MDDTELDRLAWLLVSGQETAEDVIDPAMDADTLEERALCHVYRVAILPHISEPKELFEALQRIWLEANSSRSNNYHGRALARAHNASEFNGPQLAVAAIEQGGDLFTVIRMLAEALPLFDEIETADIIQFFEVAYPRIKNDLANGIPYNALEQWLIRHPNAVEPVVSACLEAPSAALAVLLRIALVRSVVGQSAEALNRVHALRSNESKFISLPAIEALGLIEWAHFDRSEVDRAVVALREGLTSSEEDTVFSSALSALWLLNHSPGDHVLIDEIVALDMPFVVRLVGDHLAYRADAIRQHSWYPDKVTLLAGKMGQHPDSYHGVDHILSERFQDTTVSWDPIPWLDAWVGTRAEISEYEKAFPRVFPQLFAALCRRPENLCELVIHWLLQSDLGIQRAARDILSELNHIQYAGVRVPQKMLDSMNAPELVHLVRRILGNVFNDGQLVSLIWSLTDTQSAKDRTYDLVLHVMADHVGYSYPQATRVNLDRVIADEHDSSLSDLAAEVIRRMDRYYDALNALPDIKELKSSEEHRRLYMKAHQRAMNQAYKEANKTSILRLLATTIPLKAGRSSFSRNRGQVSEKMHLSSFSHSVAFPRADAIDSVGVAIERFHFQLAKVGDT